MNTKNVIATFAPNNNTKTRNPISWVTLLFVVLVALPSILAIAFFGFIASDMYVSEAQFIVRSVSSQKPGGLDALFRTFGISSAEDDALSIVNFLQSRDAVKQLEERLPLRKYYSDKNIDAFSRFPSILRNDTNEALYDYYRNRITIFRNASTGIIILKVSAFRGDHAKAIADNLLELSEQLVNRMNTRARKDSISNAQRELSEAEASVLTAQSNLTDFRNAEMMINPANNSVKILELIGQLSGELAETYAQLRQMTEASPSNPAIQSLKARASALQQQINVEQAKVSGGAGSLASKIGSYERLVFNREFADRSLTSASGTIETARQEARRQQIYIQTISMPSLADESTEPQRFRSIITVIIFSFAVFGMAWLIIAGSKEHTN